MTVRQTTDAQANAKICKQVLRDLPAWFGIEAATRDYVNKARSAPFFTAFDGESPVGFVYLHAHSAFSVEVYCMGVLRARHRAGVGKRLMEAAAQYARAQGARYLTVKTLADKHPDEGYKKTRAFYLSMGFVPLEVLDDLWGGGNPCLFLVKAL